MISPHVPTALAFILTLGHFGHHASAADKAPPRVGDDAPPLSLKAADGTQVKLAELIQEGDVAVVVLRGYPGYQCPICTRQVADLMKRRQDLDEIFAKVVFVYPGPALNLNTRMEEFIHNQSLPEPFVIVADPDYRFSNSWNLRWDQLRETAYPSTFIVGKDGTIKYARISKSHGGRVSAMELISAARRL